MSSSFYKGIVSGSLSSPRGLGRMTLSISATCFAPKKKKAGSKSESSGVTATSRQEGTDHLFNVYASYPDHVIKDDDAEYPQWVNQIGKKKIHSYGELEMKFIYGKNIESATMEQYKRFLKLHRRNRIKLNNMRLTTHRRRSQYTYKNV